MSVVVDPKRALAKFNLEDFPGRTPMQTVSNRLTDIALYLSDNA